MKVIVVGQKHASSGLIGYTCDALRRYAEVVLVDFWPEKWRRWWLYLFSLGLRYDLERMYLFRMHSMMYSCGAWRRNTRVVERKIEKIYEPGDKILHMSNLYAPMRLPGRLDYYVYVHYNITLCVRDGVKPWKPKVKELAKFIRHERDLFNDARGLFTCGRMLGKSYIDDYGVASNSIMDVGAGVDDYFLRNKPYAISESRHTCLFVGWDFGIKGGNVLLAGFKWAREQHPLLKLYIVGPEQDASREMDGVIQVGPVRNRDELLRHYRNADLFVMPSACDSFGFVFLEAMSQYVACLGCDMNSMPEIIGDGGYVVPRGDAAAVGRCILEYFSDESRMVEMKKAARKRVEDKYTWERTGRLLMEGME